MRVYTNPLEVVFPAEAMQTHEAVDGDTIAPSLAAVNLAAPSSLLDLPGDVRCGIEDRLPSVSPHFRSPSALLAQLLKLVLLSCDPTTFGRLRQTAKRLNECATDEHVIAKQKWGVRQREFEREHAAM